MANEPSNPTSAAAETPNALNRDTQIGEPDGFGETPTIPGGTETVGETGKTTPDDDRPRNPGTPESSGTDAEGRKPEKPGKRPASEGAHMNGLAGAIGEPAAPDQGDNPPSDSEAAAPAPLPEAIRLKLLTAEIRSVGAELGLLDPEAALRLMPPEAVSVNAQGEVAGVRGALTALQQSKGYLFVRAARGAWAQRMGDSAPRLTGVEEAFYRKNPTLKK